MKKLLASLLAIAFMTMVLGTAFAQAPAPMKKKPMVMKPKPAATAFLRGGFTIEQLVDVWRKQEPVIAIQPLRIR